LNAGKLIVVSAPSGSGKTTLVKALLAEKLPLAFSISATSRPPRGNEKNGVDYHFLSTEGFQKKIEANAFIEYEEVYPGKFYGTLRSEIEDLWNAGRHVVFDVDVVGGLNIKSQFPDQTLALFIQPPSLAVLEQRLRNRGTEDEALIQERIAKAGQEIKAASQFDVTIVNDNLASAKEKIIQLVKEFIQP
jgi:guanylate kinase